VNPEELLYAETHEWVHVGDDDIATIGISAYALEQLTDLVFMDLPNVGDAVKAGEAFGEVESVKAVSSLYSPVDGEIVETNNDVADNLEQLGQDPFDKGWIIKVKLANRDSLANLMDHAAYSKQCAESG
jgi:glycine cleavage system H protein